MRFSPIKGLHKIVSTENKSPSVLSKESSSWTVSTYMISVFLCDWLSSILESWLVSRNV